MSEPLDWSKLQASYWNAFSELTRHAASEQAGGAIGSAPWQNGIEQWSRLFAQQPNAQSDVVERMLASAKSYLATLQATLGGAFANPAAAFDGSGNAAVWLDSLRKSFAASNAFNVPGFDAGAFADNPFARSLREIAGQGSKGFDQLAAQIAPFIESAKQQSAALLKLPAFGQSREQQERLQKLIIAWNQYEEASQRYNAELAKAGQRSFEILEDKLAERSEPGRQIDSMRGFYDLWVDAAEEAYAEVAMTEAFRSRYGEFVNGQMRVRSLVQDEIERSTRDLGMPTRSEINSVEKRLHELRRELRRSAETGDAAMAQELAALRAEVAALRAGEAVRPTAPPAKHSEPVARAATAVKPTAVAKSTIQNRPAAAPKKSTRARRQSAAPVPKSAVRAVAKSPPPGSFAASLRSARAVIAEAAAAKAKRAAGSAKRR